jgi:DNA-binding transcriptional ArsR family regulator
VADEAKRWSIEDLQKLREEMEASGEQFVIRDVVTLKSLADPLRLQVLLEMQDGPRTVKEVASTLGVPQTRLYYHVKILERNGLIHVAGRRMVSGIEERSYQATAKSWTISPELASSVPESGLLKAMLDVLGAELSVALADDSKPIGDPSGTVPALSFTRWWLTQDEVADVQSRLFALMEDYGNRGPAPGLVQFEGVLMMYRHPTS